jgi:chloramphenicol 3-O phosphotransferase
MAETLIDPDRRGRAVFLVGPSSSGKTSIGRALVELLPDGHLFFEADRFGVSGPTNRPDLVTLERERLVTRGTAMAVRGYLDAGVNLVVERSFWQPMTRRVVAELFAPYEAWLVGLDWELAELERRERGRTDGIRPGTAAEQATAPGAWDLPYDLRVAAVATSPTAAAQHIADWLAVGPTPRALRRLAGLS